MVNAECRQEKNDNLNYVNISSPSLSMMPIKFTIFIIVSMYMVCLYFNYISNNKFLIMRKETI